MTNQEYAIIRANKEAMDKQMVDRRDNPEWLRIKANIKEQDRKHYERQAKKRAMKSQQEV